MKKEIAKFTMYSIIERVLITIVNMVSVIIVGRLGSAELSGISISNTVISILQAPFLALSTGAAISISKNEKNKQKLTWNVIVLTAIVSLILIFTVAAFSKQLIFLLFPNTHLDIKKIAIESLSMFKWALPFMGVEMALSGCLKGCRNARMPMLVTFVGNLINIILCMMFVSGFKMGYIAGTLSLVISSAITCAIRILYLLLPISEVQFSFKHKVDFNSIKEVVFVSMPFLINLFFVRIGFLGMQTITALLGSGTLTGYQITNNVLNVLYSITGGIETAQIVFVSNKCALGNKVAAKKITYKLTYIGTVSMILIGVIVNFCARPILHIFTSDEMIIKEGMYIIHLMSITIPFTSYFQCIQGSLSACGYSQIVACLSILCSWCIRMPVSYILVRFTGMGFNGLFVGFMIDYMTRCVVYGLLARKNFG